MKIEKVNENIIRVTISINDLEERNIDLNSLNYNSPAAQELFWDMMEQAEIQFGFTASNSQLVFEASQDSIEGFIVTITKLEDDGDFESIHRYIKNRLRSTDPRIKRKSRGKIYSTLVIYSFNNFDDLCTLSKSMRPTYSGGSCLYKCKSTYYLILTRNNLTASSMKTFEAILSEYGKKISNVGFYEGYLNEYGTKIIDYNVFEVISYF
jgi:adapter protein MecA 1/2